MPRYKGLEADWDHITSLIDAVGVPTYPSAINGDTNTADWPNDIPFDDFLALATRLDATLIYAEQSELDEAQLADLEQRVLQASEHGSSALSPAISSAGRGPTFNPSVILPPPAPFPELTAFMRRARACLGRTWGLQVQWVSQGVTHSYTRLADWYEALLDQLPSLSARYAEMEVLQDQQLLEREEAQLEKRARQLATTREFHQSNKTYATQNQLAAKQFPDLSLNERRDLVRVARQIYEVEVLPLLEKELAERARAMLSGGMSLTRTAAKLGVTTGRLERLLARYE